MVGRQARRPSLTRRTCDRSTVICWGAHRVVNHPSHAVGDPYRYGSDALVLGGNIYDVYGAFGDPGRSDVQALDQGPYAAGRLRE